MSQPNHNDSSHSANKKHASTSRLVRLAMLCAIIVVMSFTPLGYLRFGAVTPIEISLLTIPVVLGAILLGPGAGALLGGVFGLTSFLQCFGLSAFGVLLLGINPFLTLLLCLIPRILMGFLAGLIFSALQRRPKAKMIAYPLASALGALLNTIFFMALLLLFFGGNAAFLAVFPIQSVFVFIAGFVGLNGILEAVVCLIFGFVLWRIVTAVERRSKSGPAA